MTTDEKIALYETNLEKIEAVLAGIADNNVEQYTINGRELKKYSIPDLIKLSTHFQDKLTSLKNKARPRKVLTRFL
ncbi:hypothetical protein ACOTV5_02420 [Aliarcobacter butzleri]|uniref:hypothetical protein n=1 Tax=Aliarcobacter butzleri TaxID=28197 RepID=UPI003AFB15E0